jgi:hypothetical protein
VDALLQRAVGDVVAADLAHERDQHRRPVELRCLEARLGRLDGAPIAAEHVELPAGIEADLVEVERRSPHRASRRRIRTGVLARVAALRDHVRPQGAGGDRSQRPRLADARLSLLQVEIRDRCPIHQVAELLVVEHLPPYRHLIALRRLGAGCGVGRLLTRPRRR